MLRHLLLFLLVLGLAAPAVAIAGHCTPAQAAPSAHGCHEDKGKRMPAGAPSTVQRDCIGCATPPLASPIVVTTALTRAPYTLPMDDRGRLQRPARPATPPPRP